MLFEPLVLPFPISSEAALYVRAEKDRGQLGSLRMLCVSPNNNIPPQIKGDVCLATLAEVLKKGVTPNANPNSLDHPYAFAVRKANEATGNQEALKKLQALPPEKKFEVIGRNVFNGTIGGTAYSQRRNPLIVQIPVRIANGTTEYLGIQLNAQEQFDMGFMYKFLEDSCDAPQMNGHIYLDDSIRRVSQDVQTNPNHTHSIGVVGGAAFAAAEKTIKGGNLSIPQRQCMFRRK